MDFCFHVSAEAVCILRLQSKEKRRFRLNTCKKRSMKFRCDKSELADGLGSLLGIIPTTQTSKPIFLDFHLRTSNNTLLVEATDLDMGARIRLDRVDILEEGQLALHAVRLHSLIREIPDKSLTIESFPSQRGATVKAAGFEFKLLGEDPMEFPSIPESSGDTLILASRERFSQMLRRVAVAASRDMARFQLTGVFFELDGEKLTMTATDGKRLTNDCMTVNNPSGHVSSAIVPNRVVDVLLKILSQGTEEFSFVLGDSGFQANFGRGEVLAKVIQGTYPDYRPAIADVVKVRVTAKRTDFLAAARSAALMTDKNTATVLFRFEEGRAVLMTQDSQIGESRIEIPVRIEGNPIEVRYNPTYFIDALRCLTEDEICLEFADPERPGALRGEQNYRHLVMPLVTARS